MTKYNTFNNTNSKLNKLVLQQNKNTIKIQEEKSKPTISLGRNTHYKSARLLFDSDWFIPTLEKIPEAVTQTKGIFLPEKALYSFDIDLDLTEQFLPYLQINILAKNIPSTQMKAISQFTSSSRREIKFQLYDYNGITQMSLSSCGDTPQTREGYVLVPPDPEIPRASYWLFRYHSGNFPVPLGSDPSFLLPVMGKYIYPNELVYNICGSPAFAYSSWSGTGIVEFYELVALQSGTPSEKLSKAKEVLKAYENITYEDELPNFKGHVASFSNLPLSGNSENDFYIIDDFPQFFVWTSEESSGTSENWVNAGAFRPKAYQTIFTEQLITAKQTKKISKIDDNKFNLKLDGYTLLLSEAKHTTPWSDLLTPTYEPKGEDIELRMEIYIQNPTSFSELKKY